MLASCKGEAVPLSRGLMRNMIGHSLPVTEGGGEHKKRQSKDQFSVTPHRSPEVGPVKEDHGF